MTPLQRKVSLRVPSKPRPKLRVAQVQKGGFGKGTPRFRGVGEQEGKGQEKGKTGLLMERGGKGGRARPPLECYTCKSRGLPCDHWHQECALVRILAQERHQRPQGQGKGKGKGTGRRKGCGKGGVMRGH